MTMPIDSEEELTRILTNPNTTQDEIKNLIERDPNSNLNPFNSNLKLKLQSTSLNIDDKWFNKAAREYRQNKYKEKIGRDFRGVKIVSEGDSWFQFPFLLKDVIDWLSDDYAIWSLDAAGDTLANMAATGNIMQIIDVIQEEKPHVFLISGGGNDMFANGVFSELLNTYQKKLTPEQYFNANFDTFISKIMHLYSELFAKLSNHFPNLKIVCHGYDYIIPRTSIGIFMGNTMQEKGIRDGDLQRQIMKIAIDRLNEAQIQLVRKFPNRVFHVDCRTAVNTNNWFDEIHLNNYGFESVANRFKKVINKIA